MLHGREFYLLYYKVPFFRNSRTESNHSYNGIGWCKMEIKQCTHKNKKCQNYRLGL